MNILVTGSSSGFGGLIDTPAGQRPLRTPVGPAGEGVSAINDTVDAVHEMLLPAIGLGDLGSVKE